METRNNPNISDLLLMSATPPFTNAVRNIA